MNEYIVSVREVNIQPYRVKASSADAAVRIVADGGGEFVDNALEFSHRLDRSTWTVEEV